MITIKLLIILMIKCTFIEGDILKCQEPHMMEILKKAQEMDLKVEKREDTKGKKDE